MKGKTYKRKYKYKGDNRQKFYAFTWYLILYSMCHRGKTQTM